MRSDRLSPLAFLGWALAAPLFVFGVMDASVGGPVGIGALVAGLAFGAFAAWRSPLWPDLLGALVGCGIAGMVIGYLDRRYYEVCPNGEPVQERVGEIVVSVASCPYMDPTPWLIAGSVLVVAGTAAYVWARARGRPRSSSSHSPAS